MQRLLFIKSRLVILAKAFSYIFLEVMIMRKIFTKKAKKQKFRCFIALITAALVSFCASVCSFAEPAEIAETVDASFDVNCRSAMLMDAATGKVLYEKNAKEALPPASVTKVMTLLLIMEAIERGNISYTDTVRASQNACSMGGSQIFLEENEEMSVEDLVKSVVIASANDAAVALAEYVSGTEEAFVEQMNKRAQELGMKNTFFENTNGLDDTVERHLTSAEDIAIMSRELIKYPKITEYSSIWMDSIRNGEFGLTNTNRLVRFYKGATGLKTGSTSKAGFCISATATRNGMTLICVIMGAESRDIRNATAVSLLDYGFSTYGVYTNDGGVIENIPVARGTEPVFDAKYERFSLCVPKSDVSKIKSEAVISENISAPVKAGDVVGEVVYKIDDREIGKSKIVATQAVDKMNFLSMLLKLLTKYAEIL